MTEDKARALFAASGKRRDVLEVPEVRPTSVFLRQHDRDHAFGDRRVRGIRRVMAA